MKIAYILRSWPRLSQTFILNEILGLERLGIRISILAMTRAEEAVSQPLVDDVAAPVRYLDDPAGPSAVTHRRVRKHLGERYLATLDFALTHTELLGGYTKSSAREAFHNAVLVADQLFETADEVDRIHAHFAHDPALIGLLTHRLTGLPFSFTAHARDLYQIPESALAGRAAQASMVVTCCRSNVEHIRKVVGPDGPPIELVYHGVDLGRFRPPPARRQNDIPLVIAVGRLVAKKGFDDLLKACQFAVQKTGRFRCEIYGDGPDRDDLEALRVRLGLASVVHFCGAKTQDQLIKAYQRADLFVLAPRVTDDGDRDGVPNTVVEAMACGLPVVSTEVAGIPEAVIHGSNGLLAPPNDPHAISGCLTRLLDDREYRYALGEAAAREASRFDSSAAAHRLADLFRQPVAVAP